jgi:WD40 repeat protein
VASRSTPDGKRLIAASTVGNRGNTIHVWNVGDGKPVRSLTAGNVVSFLDVSADGCSVATGNQQGIHVQDALTWKVQQSNRLGVPSSNHGSES